MVKKICRIIFAVAVCSMALFCLYSTGRILLNEGKENIEDIGITAAGLIFTEGTVALEEPQNTDSTEIERQSSAATGSESSTSSASVRRGERTYPIIESKYTVGGTAFDNFYLKNTTDENINIAQLLKAKLPFSTSNGAEPQVLIVHTHTSEAYMDDDMGFYYESYTGRSTDDNTSVVRVGKAIEEKLTAAGIGVIHDTTHYDEPGYNGSYYRSEDGIKKYLEQYPSITVVLDIHRDALSTGDDGIIKPTFAVNGKKAAQIMIMSGCDSDGTAGFSFWKENLKFAVKLQSKAETLYPGMTRPLYFGDFVYNMNMNTGSLLIEVGTHANTLDEAVYSGELLGNVLAQVLKENIN